MINYLKSTFKIKDSQGEDVIVPEKVLGEIKEIESNMKKVKDDPKVPRAALDVMRRELFIKNRQIVRLNQKYGIDLYTDYNL